MQCDSSTCSRCVGAHRNWDGAQEDEQLEPGDPPRQPKVVAAGVLTDLIQGGCTSRVCSASSVTRVKV